jgi:hypothetical protein
VNLVDNTFASNGKVLGEVSGFNGVEFLTGYTGTAVVTGNTFQNNTANGLFVGGASNKIQITNNTFDNNIVGVFLNFSTVPIIATVQGNRFVVPVGSPETDEGIQANGSGVTVTIGGAGALENTIDGYDDFEFIVLANSPNATILANVYTRAGIAIPPSEAIRFA